MPLNIDPSYMRSDVKENNAMWCCEWRSSAIICRLFQVCRNINRIKVCMETGKTVILLNLESLYESLYDALNQVWRMSGNLLGFN